MPQQDRAYATREAILHAAAEEFDRLGYERTSLTAVLARAGLTKGAFYFHFPSKEAVADALVERQSELWARMRESWRVRGLDPLSALHGMFAESADRMAADVVLRAGVRLNADREVGYPGVPNTHLQWEKLVAAYVFEAAERGDLRRRRRSRGRRADVVRRGARFAADLLRDDGVRRLPRADPRGAGARAAQRHVSRLEVVWITNCV